MEPNLRHKADYVSYLSEKEILAALNTLNAVRLSDND